MKRSKMLIDIGANLSDAVYTGCYRGKQKHQHDLSIVLRRAKKFNVEKIIITGGTLEESNQAYLLSKEYEDKSVTPLLYSTVGVHPTRCSEFHSNSFGYTPEVYFNALLALCHVGMQSGKIVAIGECGLDYDRLEFCDRETQIQYFIKQFKLAELTKLPMFFHNRNTNGDFYDIVKRNRSSFTNGVVHSFTGTKDELMQLLDLGLYIGVNGCSLKTQENLETVKAIPRERLMIETDAPWCDIRRTHAGYSFVKTAHSSKKSEKYDENLLVAGRNEPCTLIQVLEILSAVRQEDQKQLATAIWENTQKVFFPSS